jgi:hypothetical protein
VASLRRSNASATPTTPSSRAARQWPEINVYEPGAPQCIMITKSWRGEKIHHQLYGINSNAISNEMRELSLKYYRATVVT